MLPEIKILASEVEKSHWLQALAREIGVGEEALWRELKKAKPAAADVFLPKEEEAEVQKNRRMQLESLLLGTLILHPEEAHAHLAEVPRHAIRDEQHLRILAAIEGMIAENVREHEALMAALPEEFREVSAHLAFQAEVLLERIENVQERTREFLVCTQELEREWARDRLRALAADISRAEASGEREQLATLLAEFRTVSEKAQ